MLRNKIIGIAMGLGVASSTIATAAQHSAEQTGFPNPFNIIAWGNIATAVTAPGAAKPSQGGFNILNPSRWTTGGANIFDTSTWLANTGFLPQPPIFPFNQAQLAGLMTLMNPRTYASMMNPALYGQFMNPGFYLQFMNPSNWLPWWNPMSYPAHLNPATYMQWSSSFGYAPFLNSMSYFNRMNTPASVHPQWNYR